MEFGDFSWIPKAWNSEPGKNFRSNFSKFKPSTPSAVTDLAIQAANNPVTRKVVDTAKPVTSFVSRAKPIASQALGWAGKLGKGFGKLLSAPVTMAIDTGLEGYDIYNRANQEGDNRHWTERYGDAHMENAEENAQDRRDLVTTWNSGKGFDFSESNDALDYAADFAKGGWRHAGAAVNKVWDAGMVGLDPVGTVSAYGGLVRETAGAGNDLGKDIGNRIYADSRRKARYEDAANISKSRAASLGEQAAQLKHQSPGGMNQENQARYESLIDQVHDAEQLAANTVDETENWELGNQNWLGGGNKFQDAMNASGQELGQQIGNMGDSAGMNSEQLSNLENLNSRKSEIDRMSKLYDQESGYWGGTGDFGKSVRVNVMQAKNELVRIGSEMREAKGDPKRIAQLQKEMQRQSNRINQYRQWAESANQ